MNSDNKMLVWDVRTRIFHWTLVLSLAGALLTQESEKWRLLHVNFGYTMVGLVVFRIIWGVVGTRYARFSNFIKGPLVSLNYIKCLITQKKENYIGHNPAGAVSIILILCLILFIAATGYLAYNDVGGDWPSKLHEMVSNFLLGVIGIHILGVALSSFMHKENLVKSMWTGLKSGSDSQAINSPHWLLALFLVLGITCFWLVAYLA